LEEELFFPQRDEQGFVGRLDPVLGQLPLGDIESESGQIPGLAFDMDRKLDRRVMPPVQFLVNGDRPAFPQDPLVVGDHVSGQVGREKLGHGLAERRGDGHAEHD